ncbi:MAG: hypothetical protein QF464_02900 [Myxococcota bacterium]|nr:hypothetical protein [Myxococcota bacterium]
MMLAAHQITHTDRQLVLLGAWPLWVQIAVAVTAVAVLALTAYNYRGLRPLPRRLGMLSLRLLVVAGLIALFYQPAMLEEQVARGRHVIPVLVDLSESHALPHGDASRHELVSRFVARHGDLWDTLDARDELVFHGLGAELVDLPDLRDHPGHLDDLTPSQPETRLVEALGALRAAYPNQSFGAVVVLTDGIDTGPAGRAARLDSESQALVRALDAPIVAFTLPEDGALKDLAVAEVAFNPFAFLMNATTLDAVVRVHGYEGGRVTVRLLDGSTELAAESLAITAETRDLPVSFEYVPQRLGRAVYTVAVDVAPGEVYAANNARQVVVNVIRDKIRVLQIVGQPSWDERFLRNHLKENSNLDLLSFFILVDRMSIRPAGRDETALIPFPAQELFEEELGSFDLVIFQNFNYGPFQTRQYLPNIAQYVKDGGAFLMIGGPLSFSSGGYYGTPITDILPVRLPAGLGESTLVDGSTFGPVLTEVGQHHPITRLAMDPSVSAERWRTIEPLEGVNLTLGPHGDALVLLSHPKLRVQGDRPAPVASVREVGGGRSMAVMTDTTWRWRFTAGHHGQDPRQYDRFWSQAIRWLIKDPEMDLVKVSVLGEEVRVGQAARVRVQVYRADYSPASGQPVDLIVRRRGVGDDRGEGQVVRHMDDVPTGPDGQLALEIAVDEPGVYEVDALAAVVAGRVDRGRALFVATSRKDELSKVVGDGRLLRLLAEASGGTVSTLDASEPEVPVRPPRIERVLDRRHDDLWASPWALVILALALGLEWALRRRFGYL